MAGWNLPPGCNVSDIPGNRPQDVEYDYFWEQWNDAECEARQEAFWEWMEDAGYRKATKKRREQYASEQEEMDFAAWMKKQIRISEETQAGVGDDD